MELTLNLDKIQSDNVSKYAKTILDKQNPYKNFKIENYKYAQLHRDIRSEILQRDIDISELLKISKNISTFSSNPVDLASNLNQWKYKNDDSFFRVSSLLKRDTSSINLDLIDDKNLFLDISQINNNIHFLKSSKNEINLIIMNTKSKDEYPKSIFFDISNNSNLNVIHFNISNFKSFLYFESNLQDNSHLNFVSFQSDNIHTRNEFFASLNLECNFDLFGLNINNYGVNDNYSFIQHLKPSSSSREIFKSIVEKGAITNFQGKIYVDSIAQKTDGYQMSRSLLLDDISKANNKPELEIYADDVKCSHGSTVSKLDEDQIYYFKSRGIDSEMAKKILKKAFIAEIIESIKDDNLRDYSNKIIESLLT